jgi:hypothetical protein
LFGSENVTIIPFEIIKKDPLVFAHNVCQGIGVSLIQNINSTPKNIKPSAEEMFYMLKFNRNHRFFLGGNYFERPWGHCAIPIYEKFNIPMPQNILKNKAKSHFTFGHIGKILRGEKFTGPFPPDVVFDIKNKSFLSALKLHKVFHYIIQKKNPPKLKVAFPDHYKNILLKAYAPHNKNLQRLTNMDLTSYNYSV